MVQEILYGCETIWDLTVKYGEMKENYWKLCRKMEGTKISLRLQLFEEDY